jgi:DNA-binding transcriptional ArsR family regulator
MTYQSTNKAAVAFGALGDETRRAVFEKLARRPLPVGKIASGLDISRPAVSQHLKVLKEAGLVTDQQQGTRRVYQIDPRGIVAMREYLDRFWERALTAFKEAAESDE